MNSNFNKLDVLIYGDVMLDVYIKGTSDRLSPEAPVPVIKKNSKTEVAGGAANVANNIKSLGGHFSLYGIVGYDGLEINLQMLLDDGVDGNYCYFFTEYDKPTITKTRIICNDKQICRIDKEEKFDGDVTQETCKGNFDAVIFSDYNKGSIKEGAQIVIDHCNKKGVPTFADYKNLDYEKYKNVTVIKLNEKEFYDLGGTDNTKEAGSFIHSILNPKYLIRLSGSLGNFLRSIK